jgi:hypothetical protein
MRKLGRGGEVLATCGTIALGEGCHIFTSNAAPNASFGDVPFVVKTLDGLSGKNVGWLV